MNLVVVSIPSIGSMLVYIDTASHVKNFAPGGSAPKFFRSWMRCCEFFR